MYLTVKRIDGLIKTFAAVSLLATLLAFGVSASAYADSPVTFAVGVVDVQEDGTVRVCITDAEDSKCEEGEFVFPSNGKGLVQSGQIAHGDTVDLKIVYDRSPKFRGHVTVLK